MHVMCMSHVATTCLFCRKMHKYECSEMRTFIVGFLHDLELKVKPKNVAGVFLFFLKQ